MNQKELKKILEDVKSGKTDIRDALTVLKRLPYVDLDFAKIDTHRELRRGFPEVVLCKGKRVEQIAEIMEVLLKNGGPVIATKAGRHVYVGVKEKISDAIYFEKARLILAGKKKEKLNQNMILVISAGTSDIPFAEEAAVTAEIMGNEVDRLYDVGIAGLHRLFAELEKIEKASVVIVVAGMEGALAGVVSGLVRSPVIAVPVSSGYGVSLGGLTALFGMLSGCSPGVTVVNIDNGFGAGYAASLINRN